MKLIEWIKMLIWKYKLRKAAKDDPFIYEVDDET